MVQVINATNAGGRLGAALGTGIHTGLQNLSHLKMQELQNRISLQQQAAERQRLGSLYGQLGLQNPDLIAGLPEKERLAYLQGPGGIPSQTPSIESLLTGLQIEPSQPAREIPQQEQIRELLGNLSSEQQFNPLINALLNPQQKLQGISKPAPAQLQGEAQQNVSDVLANKKPALGLFGESKQAAEERRHKEKLSAKERSEAFKFNKETLKKVTDEAMSAKSNLKDLSRMEELEKEGKLDTPGYMQFLERSGLDIPALMNEGSEEFNKIVNNFLRDAKVYYGGRVTNQEMEQFLKTIPSLSQSPEGRKRVIANLKHLNNAKLAYADTVRDIIKENKGVPPFDLDFQVYDRIDKKLDKLAEQFKKDLKKPVPQGQNRLITALQAGLGSAVGAAKPGLQGALKGATAGALWGRYGGPIGAGTGAAIGGLGGLLGLI